MKKADKTLVLTTLLCLLPMAAGLFLWDRLPEQMPIHWNAAGQVDNYGSRALAVVGLPCIMAGAHLLVHLLLRTDPHRENMSPALRTITYWILPGLCILLCAVTYMAALGIPVRVEVIVPLAIGVLFMAIGNYLPKYRQNYTMGIRTIMQARKVLMVANGAGKAEIVKKAFFGPVTPEVPASILQMHPDFTLVGDEEALSLI